MDENRVQDWIIGDVFKPSQLKNRNVVLNALKDITGASLNSLNQEGIQNDLLQSGLSFVLSYAFAKRIIGARDKFLCT